MFEKGLMDQFENLKKNKVHLLQKLTKFKKFSHFKKNIKNK